MPKTSSKQNTFPHVKVRGLSKEYEYSKWIQESLIDTADPLNYFSFADNFANTEQNTNTHYNDLLTSLTGPHQSKKLIGLAQSAKRKFDVIIIIKYIWCKY